MSIQVNNLTKFYGQQKAIDNISFQANEGEILGLLGPNGAGKTTTMKILTCFMPQSSGDVSVCGFDTRKNDLDIKKIMGYLPEHNPLYGSMYIKEYLTFVAAIHKLDNKSKHVDRVIEETGLSKEKNKRISELSKGYRQRVGLAQAIIHDPKVLILDEPISGLDPNQLIEIRSLINSLKKNKTIIFSSHILQEVESICDRIMILNNGQVVQDNLIENITENTVQSQKVLVEFLNNISEEVLHNHLDNVRIKQENKRLFEISYNGENDIRSLIFDLAVKQENKILEMKSKGSSLEDVFKEVTKKN
ncbi:MAG: ATP-binding cassette domain-containing protein [Saprospiraceae bacterium]|nr:ATP-binding cassette domain-containing protein [Bacteroidia bacterium]NNL92563.1 ATP-binding cassette domain-containing protein [Saprospiraceae bacterium]